MATYTAGSGGPYRTGKTANGEETEQVSDTPDLDAMRDAVHKSQSDAAWFAERNRIAYDVWHSRWAGQTVDGRKHRNDTMAETDLIWPWEGACDTRARTCDKIIREHMTIALFAVLNMKVQAKSTRPVVTIRESQQVTTLLNWMLFTHMQPQLGREIMLALNWRFALGSCALEVVWDQQRRIDYTEVTTIQLAQLVNEQLGQDGSMDQFAQLINDPQYEDLMVGFVQSLSPIVSVPQARSIVKDFRTLRYAEIPIPYVFISRPRWTALRFMVDLLIPAQTDSLQNARWADRIEWVTETELTDRIETHGYDPDFVDEAIAQKGKSSSATFTRADATFPIEGGPIWVTGSRRDDFEERIELHNFWQKGHDRGVPTLYLTTFHMDVPDIPAKHGPCEYLHAEFPFHELRNEYHERAILTSRGIPEIAYTWEAEIKAQRDGRTDRTDLALRPPLMAHYQDVQRIKQQWEPGVIFPERRDGSTRFFNVPPADAGSVQIEEAVKLDIAEFFGLFGATIDPSLKQQRQMELADLVLEETKPPINQTWKLMQQYLPDADVVAVVGELSRPGELSSVDRADIQGQHEITATCDMRELDKDWLKEKGVLVAGIIQMDKAGVIDTTSVIQNMMSALDYNMADMSIKDQSAATDEERDDEINKVSQIIGSGLDLPLPKQGSNFQLRLQTLQQTLQDALQNNPATQKQIQSNPDVMKVLEKRAQYYQNQLQQQENAQIGRSLTTRTFTKQAPVLASPTGGNEPPAAGMGGMMPPGGMGGAMGGPGGGAPPGY